MKRFFAALLTLLWIMPGAAFAQSAPMGRYVEREISLPDGIKGVNALSVLADGTLSLYGTQNGIVRAQCKDGAWTLETPAWLSAIKNPDNIITYAPQGDGAWVLLYGSEQNNYQSELFFAEGEALTKLELLDLDNYAYLTKIAVAENGDLILGGNSQVIYQVDSKTGREINAYENVSEIFFVSGNELVASSPGDQSIVVYDLTTGEALCTLSDAPLSEMGMDALACDAQSVYIANGGGIYRIAKDGSLWERMVDGALTSLNRPTAYAQNLVIQNGEPMLVLSDYNGGMRLLRFVFDASVPTLPEKELRVYTLRENQMLTQAVSVFQTAHPDYLVNVTVLLQDDSAADATDVIRTLNTELLAGNGPDVLLLDGMPADAYIEKGVLYDLSAILDPLISDGTLFENIVGAFRQESGAICEVPSGVMLPVALHAKDTLVSGDGIEALVALAESRDAEKPAMPRRKIDGRLTMLLPVCYPDWFDENGALRETEFANFLTAIATINKTCGTETDPYEEAAAIDANVFAMASNIDAMGLMGGRTHEITGLKSGLYALYPMMLHGFSHDMIELTALDQIGGTFDFLAGQSKCVFAPRGMMGVNARSGQLEAALAFVQTMLSQDVQDIELYGGFPVNARSMQKLVETEKGDYSIAMSIPAEDADTSEPLEGAWPTRTLRERTLSLIKAAQTPFIANNALIEMMKGALKPFFAGAMDAQTAAKQVAEKVRAYLAE